VSVSSCPTEEALLAFLEGGLARHESDRVVAHAGGCDGCAAVLATFASGVSDGPSRRSGGEPGAAGAAGASGIAPAARVDAPVTMGRYAIVRPVGAGAMGIVYEAHDPELDRRVALKVLRAQPTEHGSEDGRAQARLLGEARAMAKLAHPNVVTVYDVGALGDRVFVAMELVSGGTLASWLREAKPAWAAIVARFVLAGRGLEAAHRAGLVHRDFKPENVLVSDDGRTLVTDFGLARASRDGDGAATLVGATGGGQSGSLLTRTGALIGTPAYMAPEQLRGEAADARSDMFAFCTALYEALYGERPFAGTSLAAIERAIMRGALRTPRGGADVPPSVHAVIARGLQAAPSARHASMGELLDALAPERHRPRRALRPAAIGVAVAALAAVGVAVRAAPGHAIPGASSPAAIVDARTVPAAPTAAATTGTIGTTATTAAATTTTAPVERSLTSRPDRKPGPRPPAPERPREPLAAEPARGAASGAGTGTSSGATLAPQPRRFDDLIKERM
jgi:tRNA A-37 threonylcarbamoyl transferase component Bud32